MLVQLSSILCFAVLSVVTGYKFGLGIGIFVAFLSVIVYVFSGLGNRKDGQQSVEVKGRKAKKGHTIPRVLKGYENGVKTIPAEGVTTLYENFQNGVKLAGDRPCLGHRPSPGAPFVTQTYKEVNTRINNFGSGLIKIGLQTNERVGFYAKNCVSWVIGAESCNAYSFTSVAIYDTLGVENREYVVEQSEVRAIVTTPNLLTNVCDLKKCCPKLEFVIFTESASDEEKAQAKDAGLDLYGFKEIEDIGAQHFTNPIPPKPEDLAILMYTSGTTSRPKGVMISHANVVAVVAGVIDIIPGLSCKDSYFSYLPLAHILERAAEASMFSKGAAIGFFSGDIRKLSDDVAAWKPTIYAGVPKVYQRVMNTVLKKIDGSPAIVKALFHGGFALKKKCIKMGIPVIPAIVDAIVFKKVAAALGGRVRFMVTGGAPISYSCHEFIRICFGCTLSQGYGLTETCGGATATPDGMVSPYQKAGAPFSCSEVKLVSAGKYSVDDPTPQGEVCVRGANITMGYYKNKEKTDEAFVTEEDGERWFHTGDVGQWNSDGTLSIVGRVKDIFKLDGGEYIAPERLETVYCQSKLLSNIFVYGDSYKSNVVAIAIPDAIAAKDWADKNGVKYSADVREPNTPQEICDNKEFTKLIQEDLLAIAKDSKFQRFEQLPAIALDGTYWTPDTGLVTDAMKNKRDPLYQQYSDKVAALYKQLGQ